MKPDKNSAYNKNRKEMQRRNMSHMMIDMAENDKMDNLGSQPDRLQDAKSTGSQSATTSTDDEVVNKPLMECYPEIADDEHETLLADVRRHWLGRFFIIAGGSLISIIMLLVPLVLPSLASSINFTMTTELRVTVALIFMFIAVLTFAGMLISLWVYNHSRMLITDQNLIEVRQMSIF